MAVREGYRPSNKSFDEIDADKAAEEKLVAETWAEVYVASFVKAGRHTDERMKKYMEDAKRKNGGVFDEKSFRKYVNPFVDAFRTSSTRIWWKFKFAFLFLGWGNRMSEFANYSVVTIDDILRLERMSWNDFANEETIANAWADHYFEKFVISGNENELMYRKFMHENGRKFNAYLFVERLAQLDTYLHNAVS